MVYVCISRRLGGVGGLLSEFFKKFHVAKGFEIISIRYCGWGLGFLRCNLTKLVILFEETMLKFPQTRTHLLNT